MTSGPRSKQLSADAVLLGISSEIHSVIGEPTASAENCWSVITWRLVQGRILSGPAQGKVHFWQSLKWKWDAGAVWQPLMCALER